ncbi:hypothetical protein ACPRR3_00845 [Enterobacter asburiae]|jgi:hypothetical protein|uniref:Uncharacterized protein n=2 Tax=Enterobacter asburiae TaxID=61645 RepID=A0AAQ1BI62_ENTAS|nr:hypothetical protein [Enterobacter asburiae]MBS7116772.1 hypothetical protein [Enterobacter cloacae]EKW1577756.1 hypothetical protein [Enterobacter asburiae]ELW9467431.1 hypothetical protein [Enterobacter asburiae]KJP21566.1 hypothetical protein SR74_05650 [Enterobacter asburiae]KLP85965.1 hypothetical protein ABF78_22535 [Enterobacter asburiae]
MVLPGMNPETNLPGYDYARMAGLGAADFDFKALGSAMDCNREFAQAGIIYSDGAQRYLVRSGQRHPNGQSGIVTHVIVTKANSQPSTSSVGKSLTDAVTSTSMGTELASTVLSCGAMIITGGVMLAGTAATPLTAGGSGVLVAIGYAGTLATGLQCVNGLYRIYDLVENGGGNVAWLDTQEWYVATSTSLDVISLASAGGALKEAVTTWRAMKSISSLKATEWLKNYPRQDRARLTELIIRAQNPGISNKEIKALIRAGLYPKRFPTGPVQVELTRQLGQVVTSAAALAGSAVSGVIAAPSNLPRTGKYIIGTIQSLAVF